MARRIIVTVFTDLRGWRRNYSVIMSFLTGFILCYLLSDKVISFSRDHGTSLEMHEPFIWTFGDSVSVMLVSLLLIVIFSNMPSVGQETPFLLVRTDRLSWILGHILYMMIGTVIYITFILGAVLLLSARYSYMADVWSRTAAVMGYSDIGISLLVPSYVKVMEFAHPYRVTLHIYGLMLGYSLVLSGIILVFNLLRKNAGVVAGLLFSMIGMIFNPDVIFELMKIPKERYREANILFGWLSPLNHATYYMHSFGYDELPKLWQSYLFFGGLMVILILAAVFRMRSYSFSFTGTETG